MTISKTKEKIVLTLEAGLALDDIQDVIDWLTFKEATKNSRATQSAVDKLVRTIKKGRWNKRKLALLK